MQTKVLHYSIVRNVSRILLMFLEIEINEHETVSFVPCTYSKLYGLCWCSAHLAITLLLELFLLCFGGGWSKHLLYFIHVITIHRKLWPLQVDQMCTVQIESDRTEYRCAVFVSVSGSHYICSSLKVANRTWYGDKTYIHRVLFLSRRRL